MRLVGYTLLPVMLFAMPVYANSLIPHRAVYDLSMESSSESSGITGLGGRMVYQLEGTPERGYEVTFRFVTRIEMAESSTLTDQQTKTFEAGDGATFSFSTRSFVDQKLESELEGRATQDGGATRVVLSQPEPREIDLDATQFPTQHLLELMNHARAGETFYQTTIFDGSDAADRAMTTTIVIGRQEQADRNDPEFKALGPLESTPFWPVEVAYFDLSEGNGEEIPSYRISFKLYESGVSRDLIMDYGDFSIAGRLVALDLMQEANDAPRTEK